jgi:toxin ParE1/3/4
MSGCILKKPRVERDLIEHYEFIARDKVAPAERLLKVAAESFERLAAMPNLGRAWKSPLPHLAGIRCYPMPSGFRNYLIFYRPIEGGVEILTVVHGARNLEAALSRIIRGPDET